MSIPTEPFIRRKAKGASSDVMHDAKSNAEIEDLSKQADAARDEAKEARDQLMKIKAENEEEQGKRKREILASKMVAQRFPGAVNENAPVEAPAQGEDVFEEHQSELDAEFDRPDPTDMFVSPPTKVQDEETNADIDEMDDNVGGRYNNSTVYRFLDPDKGLMDLMDKRSDAMSDETRGTNFDVASPTNTSKTSGWDPRGSGVNSMSYGVPVPLIPKLIADMQRSWDKENYSKGYQESYATALLAALGLGGEAYPGLNVSALPEYDQIRNLRVGSEGITGEEAFRRWFEGAMKAQGMDPAEARRRFQEPLRRAMLISQLYALGDNDALDTIRGLTKARRQAWGRKNKEAEEEAVRNIEKFYEEYAPAEGVVLPERVSPTTVLQIISDAMNGSAGDIELGQSLRWLVNEDLRSPDPVAPVSVKDLDTTMSNYNAIPEILSDPALYEKYLPMMVNGKIRSLIGKYGEAPASPMAKAAIMQLKSISDRLAEGAPLTDRDSMMLARWGISTSPKDMLAQLLGSRESANNFWKILQYDMPEEERTTGNYFMPREDLARKMQVDDIRDVEDLPRSERGYYLRDLVNSLKGELDDIVAGNNVITNSMADKYPSKWDRLRYAIHRAGKDSLKKKFTDTYSSEDLEALKNLDRKKGQWSWMDPEIREMMSRLKTEDPTEKDMDLLRKMGYLRTDRSLAEHPIEYVQSLFDAKGLPIKLAGGQPNGETATFINTFASLSELKDAAEQGLIQMKPAQLRRIGTLLNTLPKYIAESGAFNHAKYKDPDVYRKYDGLLDEAKRIISDFGGNIALEEVGLKTFPGGADLKVEDLGGNTGDILRYMTNGELSMTRPQTYATAVNYYDLAKGLRDQIERDVRRMKDIPYLLKWEEDPDRREELEAEKKMIEEGLPELREKYNKYRAKLPYAVSATDMDRNAIKTDEEDVAKKSSRLEEVMDTLKQNKAEYDQFVAGMDEFNNLIDGLDPSNVAKNLLLALARKELEKDQGAYRAAIGALPLEDEMSVKTGDKEVKGHTEPLDAKIQMWPLLNDDMVKRWWAAFNGDEKALEPRSIYSEEDLQDKIIDALLGTTDSTGGHDPRETVYSKDMFEYFRPVSDEDLALAREQFQQVPNAIGKERDARPYMGDRTSRALKDIPDEELTDEQRDIISETAAEESADRRFAQWAQDAQAARQDRATEESHIKNELGKELRDSLKETEPEVETPISMGEGTAFEKLRTMVEAAMKDIPPVNSEGAALIPHPRGDVYLAYDRPAMSSTVYEDARQKNLEARRAGRKPEYGAEFFYAPRHSIPEYLVWADPEYEDAVAKWKDVVEDIRQMKTAGWGYDRVWDFLINNPYSAFAALPKFVKDYIIQNYNSPDVISLKKSIFSRLPAYFLRTPKGGMVRMMPFTKSYLMRETGLKRIKKA